MTKKKSAKCFEACFPTLVLTRSGQG